MIIKNVLGVTFALIVGLWGQEMCLVSVFLILVALNTYCILKILKLVPWEIDHDYNHLN